MTESAYIDVENLTKFGGAVVENGVELHDWHFESVHARMSKDRELDELKAQLGDALKTPEIVFADASLRLRHLPTGFEIEFCAVDALRAWKAENRPPLQLSFAAQWQEQRRQHIEQQNAKQLHYDWTFTTPYAGTYRQSSTQNRTDPGFEPCTEGLDLEELRSREPPILYYDRLCLYESELDDMGCCQCRIWIRVMPEYWFIVLRFFLRVDHHLIRLYETRLFARFGPEVEVKREIKQWDVSFEELRQSDAPTEMLSYRDAESTAAILQSVMPMGLRLDRSEKLRLS